MDFSLSKTQLEVQEKVREYAQKVVAPGAIARDDSKEFPEEIVQGMAKEGFVGIPIPKEFGGQGLGYQEYAIAMEELSKVDAGVSVARTVNTSLYGGTILTSDATPEQIEKFFGPVIRGEKIGCFGLTEPSAGSDVAGALTMAVKDGDDWVINGSKCFITNGPVADYIALFAYTDKDLGPAKSMACFIVPTDTEGLVFGDRHNTSGIHCGQVGEFYFNDMRIPNENMICESGEGFKLAMKVLDSGRIGVAAQALGIAEGAFEIAKEYMKERVQFGKPIWKNQYLGFKMAELEIDIDNARHLVYRAAWERDNNISTYGISAAKAKLYASDCAMRVTTDAIQVMGGSGYMKEYQVERMFRDAKITQIYEGTNEIQRLVLSNALFR